jgi:hypothetical protein
MSVPTWSENIPLSRKQLMKKPFVQVWIL